MIRYSILAILMVLFASHSANASILGGVLSHDGIEDKLEDESFTQLEDTGTTGISVGDVYWGWASISDVSGSTVSPVEIAIIYSFTVTGISTTTGNFIMSATDASDAHSITNLLDDFAPETNGLGDAAFIVLANDGGVDPLTSSDRFDPDDVSTLFNGTDWTYQLTGGFSNATDSVDYSEFDLNPDGRGFIGTQIGGFSVLDHNMGGSIKFNGVDLLGFDGATTSHDITLDSAQISVNDEAGSLYDFEDNADFFINTVPEPASIASFGILLCLGTSIALRRGRQAKAKS